MVVKWILFFGIVGQLEPAECVYKRWLPNTNYNNPDNWDTGTAPCPNDVIHFPDSKSPVFVQANISTMSLVLPVNGELVLGDGVMIVFPTERSNDANCPGQDIQFVGTSPRSWLDPANWCEATSPGWDCLKNQPPRLDTERVPCQNDQLLFPQHSTLDIELENVDLVVASVTITGKPTGSKEYVDTVKSWSASGSLNIQEDPQCEDDQAGCLCGNDHGKIRDVICAHVTPHCPAVHCVKPIRVEAHCCPICGAKMELQYNADFRFNTLYNALKYLYNQQKDRDDVSFVMTRSSAGHVVVVLWDEAGGHAAETIAHTMANKVQTDISSTQKYGVTEVKIYTSAGSGPSTGAQTDSTGGLKAGSIAGIILSLGLLLVIIILCIICFADRSKFRSITSRFAHWGKKEDEEQLDGSMELGVTPGVKDMIFSDLQAMPTGFDNPLYGSASTVNGREAGGVLDANANNTPVLAPATAPADAPETTPPCTTEIDLSASAPEDVTFSTGKKTMSGNTAFDNPMYGTPKKMREKKSEPYSTDGGFTNPMYSENGNSVLQLNPVYSTEGVDEESDI